MEEMNAKVTELINSGANKNNTVYKSAEEVSRAVNRDQKCSSANPLLLLESQLENLKLSQITKLSNVANKHLAGYIKAVIPPSGTVVIQLAPGSKLLAIGTVIFVQKDDADKQIAVEYIEIGFISDIFGSVSDPMYSVQIKQRVKSDSLKLDSKVFYMLDHPSTRYVNVIRESENRYTVIEDQQ